MSSTIAIVLAGGIGHRYGGDTPKQFLPLGGRPVIMHSIEAFAASSQVDGIIVVCHQEWLSHLRVLLSERPCPKVSALIPGGETRGSSTMAALAHLTDTPPDTRILIHDAARPGLSQELIARVIDALQTYKAATPVLPLADSIARIDSTSHLAEMPPRHNLRLVQTPQGFHLGTLQEAYRLNASHPYAQQTDDCSLILQHLPNTPTASVTGELQNMKITTENDLHILEYLLHYTNPNRNTRP